MRVRHGHEVASGGPTSSGLGVSCCLVHILPLLQLSALTNHVTLFCAWSRQWTMRSRLKRSACSSGPRVRASVGAMLWPPFHRWCEKDDGKKQSVNSVTRDAMYDTAVRPLVSTMAGQMMLASMVHQSESRVAITQLARFLLVFGCASDTGTAWPVVAPQLPDWVSHAACCTSWHSYNCRR